MLNGMMMTIDQSLHKACMVVAWLVTLMEMPCNGRIDSVFPQIRASTRDSLYLLRFWSNDDVAISRLQYQSTLLFCIL
jgi:type II secretory pathway component PulK